MSWERKKRLVVAALLCGLLIGCVAMEAQKRLKEYEGYFEPLIGKAQPSDITRKLGNPLRKDKIGKTELWYYHIPYRDPKGGQGSRGFEGGYAVGPRARSTTT